MFLGSLFFYYGAILIGTGTYDFGGVMVAMTLLIFGMGSVTAALAFMPQIATSRVTARQVLDLINFLQQPSELALLPTEKSQSGFSSIENRLPIVMRKLNFAYPLRSDVPVLKNLTLKFEAHQFTALVGSSGSGKSTIAAILLALYAPSSSNTISFIASESSPVAPLTFGGVPSLKIDLLALCSHMALVPQFPTIFPATAAENITCGLPASSPLCEQANIEAAARSAGIHDFVASFTNGYQTLIGESGQGLSGGQQMRIAIARALVRRTKVMVPDEPTAGLDGESADLVADALRNVVKDGAGVAMVVITHDLRIMKAAERVVVLDEGASIGEGRFKKLRWKGGVEVGWWC